MKRVLFVCVHNSARSQMAEAFLNQLGKGKFFAESAGLEPGKLNPLVVRVMSEIGIDISKNSTILFLNILKRVGLIPLLSKSVIRSTDNAVRSFHLPVFR